MNIEVTTKVRVKVPTVPTYLRIDGSDTPVDIAELSDEMLSALAKEWTKALLAHAKRRREGI